MVNSLKDDWTLGSVGITGAIPEFSNHLVWLELVCTILVSAVSKPGLDTCTLSPTLEYGWPDSVEKL